MTFHSGVGRIISIARVSGAKAPTCRSECGASPAGAVWFEMFES